MAGTAPLASARTAGPGTADPDGVVVSPGFRVALAVEDSAAGTGG